MDNFLQQLAQQFSATFGADLGHYTLKLLGAVAVLAIGWLAARAVSDQAKASLQKSDLDSRVGGWMSGEGGASGAGISDNLSKGVFWMLMILVLAAFFHVLGFSLIAEPMNRLLARGFEFFPNVLKAGLLVVVAWAVANLSRKALETALAAGRVDEKFGEQVGSKGKKAVPLSRTISTTAYWLVLFLFTPMVLEALKITALVPPIQVMLNRIFGDFLLNVVGAGLLLIIGWVLARTVQRIVSNLLSSAIPESFGETFGMADVLGKGRLAHAGGIVVFVFILLLVSIQAMGVLKFDAITQPATQMLQKVLGAVPTIVVATLVMIVAFFVGKMVFSLVSSVLSGLGFNHILVALGLAKSEPAEGKRTPSEIAGYVAMVAVIWLSAIQAFEVLGLTAFVGHMNVLTAKVGNIVLGALIFGVGLYLANLASRTIHESESSESWILAPAAKLAIIFLSGSMALRQTDLASTTVDTAFALVLGSVAVAVAIAFGIGGKDIAARELEGWIKAIRSKKND